MKAYIQRKITYYKNLLSKNKKKYITITIVLASLTVAILIGMFIIYKVRTTIPKGHIYVCDNAEEYSEFDTWIREEQTIKWVPTFLIIKDGMVAGQIKGTINESDFSSDLGTCLLFPLNMPLPDYKITNIVGHADSLKDIVVTNDLYIIEISWLTCPDCIEQEKLNKSILGKYTANNFYIYYMKSDRDEVIEHYN